MKLTEWARQAGIHPKTAYRWYRNGTLPVAARKVGTRTILIETEPRAAFGGFGLYARVSSHDQRGDLDRQVAKLSAWAAATGLPVVRVEAEVGSGMHGSRPKLRRLLGDPLVTTVVVEHKDRLARMNAELVEAALAATGRRLVVLEPAEMEEGLVRDMTEVLASYCARAYGRASAHNRAEKALRCAKADVGPRGPAKVVSP